MLEFSSSDARHDFKVDGHTYWLPAVSVGDLEDVAALANLEGQNQIEAFRDLIVSRVQPTTRTFTQWVTRVPAAPVAVKKLSIMQLAALFKAWSTMDGVLKPGE